MRPKVARPALAKLAEAKEITFVLGDEKKVATTAACRTRAADRHRSTSRLATARRRLQP
jgi:hypothetical protein